MLPLRATKKKTSKKKEKKKARAVFCMNRIHNTENRTRYGGLQAQSDSHFLSHFNQKRTTTPWCFLFSRHQEDKLWIDSIVFVTPWNRRSRLASRATEEELLLLLLRPPPPLLAASAPAAIFPSLCSPEPEPSGASFTEETARGRAHSSEKHDRVRHFYTQNRCFRALCYRRI